MWSSTSEWCIVKLLIPPEAKTVLPIHSTYFETYRKRRTNMAIVLELQEANPGAEIPLEGGQVVTCASGVHTSSVAYTVGGMVYPDRFDPNPNTDCAPGIHYHEERQHAFHWIDRDVPLPCQYVPDTVNNQNHIPETKHGHHPTIATIPTAANAPAAAAASVVKPRPTIATIPAAANPPAAAAASVVKPRPTIATIPAAANPPAAFVSPRPTIAAIPQNAAAVGWPAVTAVAATRPTIAATAPSTGTLSPMAAAGLAIAAQKVTPPHSVLQAGRSVAALASPPVPSARTFAGSARSVVGAGAAHPAAAAAGAGAGAASATQGLSARAAAGVSVAQSGGAAAAAGAAQKFAAKGAAAAAGATAMRPLAESEKAAFTVQPCVVCCEERPTHVILDCGHLCMCKACVATYKCLKMTSCPACRGKIKEWRQVYF
jgi:hypothetical protein